MDAQAPSSATQWARAFGSDSWRQAAAQWSHSSAQVLQASMQLANLSWAMTTSWTVEHRDRARLDNRTPDEFCLARAPYGAIGLLTYFAAAARPSPRSSPKVEGESIE